MQNDVKWYGWFTAVALGGLVAVAGCSPARELGSTDAESAIAANSLEVRRTSHGVVHVKADDYLQLGYGLGYVYAVDNFCMLAEHIVTVSGERSRYFGPDAKVEVNWTMVSNLESDLFYAYYIDDSALARAYERVSPKIRDMMQGYAAGYNRYLESTGPGNVAQACRDADWLRPITLTDMYRLFEDRLVMASGGALVGALVAAAPPQGTNPQADSRSPDNPLPDFMPTAEFGSNGWAFGLSVTANSSGLLMANPHFPWSGTKRFYQMHLTVPGELDVMGVSLGGMLPVAIGFNQHVAWTHTVSTARRFTLFELELDPADPTRYRYDGETRSMTQKSVRVSVLEENGAVTDHTHTFYETVFGPVVSSPAFGLGWTAGRAYALGDANKNNVDSAETWLRINQAQSVAEIADALQTSRAIPWINTIASDRYGDAYYADIGRVPGVTNETLEECRPSDEAAALVDTASMFVLDGTRSTCNWTRFEDPFLPVNLLASVKRDDFVLNSNNSYWLTTPDYTFPDLPRILGPINTPQGLRTRMGLKEMQAQLDGRHGEDRKIFTPEVLRGILFSNRNYAASLVLDELPETCAGAAPVALEDGTAVDIGPACSTLSRWDRTSSPESQGGLLFREFWKRARVIENLYDVPFDVSQPAITPHSLNTGDASVKQAVLRALAQAASNLEQNGYAVDATLGAAQFAFATGERVAVPGGPDQEGVLNMAVVPDLTPEGYTPSHGSSYIQFVTFSPQGPAARGLLTYGQSTDPASPWNGDQLRVFAAGEDYPLPYTEAEIASDPGLQVVSIPPLE